MARNEVHVILVLFIAVVILVTIVEFFKKNSEVVDAKNFILEDLAQKYPGADIEIITTKENFNSENERYYEIKAKVTLNPNTPCPERMHIYYNYPEQNFVPKVPEYITTNCVVCKDTACDLIFPEEAIIASHTLDGTEEIHEFILNYPNAKPEVSENSTSWTVSWTSEDANYFYTVSLLKNGTLLSKTKTFKT